MTTRICTREGCERHVYARGKCVSHYNSYIKSLRRKGSSLHAAVDTWAEVQKYMPGTVNQLAEATGIAYNTVLRILNLKHAAREAHICKYLPPQQTGGARWVRVFAAGPGKDRIVTAEQKAIHVRKTRRQQHAAKKAGITAPKFCTTWNLAFFNPMGMTA